MTPRPLRRRGRIAAQLYTIQLISLALFISIGIYSNKIIIDTYDDKNDQYAQSLLQRAGQNADRMLQDIGTVSYYFCYSESVQQLYLGDFTKLSQLSSYKKALESFYFLKNTQSSIVDAVVLPTNTSMYLFAQQLDVLLLKKIENILTAHDRTTSAYYYLGAEDYGTNRSHLLYIMPVYSSLAGSEFGQQQGVCLILVDMQPLRDILAASVFEGTDIQLRDASGRLLASASGGGDQSADRLLQVRRYPIANAPWTLTQRSFRSGILNTPQYSFILIATTAIAGIAMILMMAVTRRNISLPISRMGKELTRIAKDPELQSTITVNCKNELASITDHINEMLLQIYEDRQRKAETQQHMLKVQLSMNRLQLSNLENQINPHFLYNTLATICGIALENDLPVVADIAAGMATLFRYSIKAETFVRLRDEIDIVEQYIDLMNYRMDSKFHVDIDIPQDLLDTRMVKMVFQPLVENSIFHGLETLDRQGTIRITAQHVDGNAYELSVWDNGCGIEPERVRLLNMLFDEPPLLEEEPTPGGDRVGIGMLNADRKIKILLGNEYGLRVRSSVGEYTEVVVKMPLTHS